MSETKEYRLNLPYWFSEERRLAELKVANLVRSQNKFKVLDVCCRRFPRGFGVDMHPKSNADLICDVHNLKGLDDDQFDFTVCVEGIEHLDDPSRAVREWARVSKFALMVTTQNIHCWRRWLKLFSKKPCTSIDHVIGWDEYTFHNFWRRNFPQAFIELSWYDRYPKKTSRLKPQKLFRENMAAFVWFEKFAKKERRLFNPIYSEALRLINSRPEDHPLWKGASEYVISRKLSSKDATGVKT